MKFSELDRLTLLYKNFTVARNNPPLTQLESIESPKQFSLAVLPYVSRTFSLFISLLPNKTVLPCTVAYLYCRMLDTYEDLIDIDNRDRIRLLGSLPSHLQGQQLIVPHTKTPDNPEDHASLLLLKKSNVVRDAFFLLPKTPQASIVRLINTMSQGMCWNITQFEKNKGCLTKEAELKQYCYNVAGCVGEFLDELFQWHYNHEIIMNKEHARICAHLGEILQMVNMAKDIKKDFNEGRVYEPHLGNFIQTHRIAGLTEDQINKARQRFVGYVRNLFEDIPHYLSFHKYKMISRGRGAILFPFIMAHQIYKTMEKNSYSPHNNKKILRNSLAQSLQAMLGKKVRFV